MTAAPGPLCCGPSLLRSLLAAVPPCCDPSLLWSLFAADPKDASSKGGRKMQQRQQRQQSGIGGLLSQNRAPERKNEPVAGGRSRPEKITASGWIIPPEEGVWAEKMNLWLADGASQKNQ